MKRKVTRIDYSKRFDKHLKKAPLGIKIAFRNRLSIFIQDPFHPQFNNNSLTGRLTGFRSINITGLLATGGQFIAKQETSVARLIQRSLVLGVAWW